MTSCHNIEKNQAHLHRCPSIQGRETTFAATGIQHPARKNTNMKLPVQVKIQKTTNAEFHKQEFGMKYSKIVLLIRASSYLT